MEDVPLEYQFEQIAAIAASSRCAIYPVDVRGLTIEEPVRRTAEDVRRETREKFGVLFEAQSSPTEGQQTVGTKEGLTGAG
jgi:hypothetical protein